MCRRRNEYSPPETIVCDVTFTAAQNVSPETIGYPVAGSCLRCVSLRFPQEHSRQRSGGRRHVCSGLSGAFGVHGSNRVRSASGCAGVPGGQRNPHDRADDPRNGEHREAPWVSSDSSGYRKRHDGARNLNDRIGDYGADPSDCGGAPFWHACADGPVIELAKKRGLVMIEDCAQAFTGPDYTGHPETNVAMFSFGSIKTMTALGGALLRVRDADLLRKMRTIQRTLPMQRRKEFAGVVLTHAILKLFTLP